MNRRETHLTVQKSLLKIIRHHDLRKANDKANLGENFANQWYANLVELGVAIECNSAV